MYTVVGIFSFKDEALLEKSMKEIKPLLDHVVKNEPDTLSFVLNKDTSDPLTVFATEYYTNQESFADVHLKSEPSKNWSAYINPLIETGDVKVVRVLRSPAIEGMGFAKR